VDTPCTAAIATLRAKFFRPPDGNHDADVRSVAADLRYAATTLWNGSLSDSAQITEEYLLQMADRYFTSRLSRS